MGLNSLKQRIPRFSIVQMLMLTVLVAILLAMVVNAGQKQPAQAFSNVCFSPSGSRLALAGEENTLFVDVATGYVLATLPIRVSRAGGPDLLSFITEDQLAIVGHRAFSTEPGVYVCSFNEDKFESKLLFEVPSFKDGVAVGPTGYAIRDSRNNVLEFRTYDSEKAQSSVPIRKSDDRVGLSPAGDAVTLFSGFHKFRGPGMAGPNPLTELVKFDGTTTTFAGPHSNAVVSPDGSKILLSGFQKGAELVDSTTGEVFWSCPEGLDSEESKFSADGNQVAIHCKKETRVGKSLERDNFVMVLDAETGEEQLRIDTCDRRDSSFAFSPDGKMLALAEPDEYFRGVELWSIDQRKQVMRRGGTRQMTFVVFPLMILLWTVFWMRTKKASAPVDDADRQRPTRKFRIGYAALAVLGFLVVCFFSTICFFTMSNNGIFAHLPFWNKMMAVVVVITACLGGVCAMVIGTGRARTGRNS